MKKREEIREGIAELFKIARQEGALSKWADGKADADEVLSNLHSQGCVLKVDKELPIVPQAEIAPMYDKVFREGINAGQYNMLKAGYVAVEPLIEEK